MIVKPHTSRHGFTIVEFMVATTVFSVVLLIVTFAIMHISRIYQKSINASRTQAVARNILDTASQSVQYSNGTRVEAVAGSTMSYCIGGTRQFLYVPGVRRASATANSTMTTRQPVDANCSAVDIRNNATPAVGQQLVPINMRVTHFAIDPVAGSSAFFRVTVKVAYGEDDVLCNTAVAGSCNPGAPTISDFTGMGVQCKNGSGSEFCSTSELSTMVQRRL